MADSGIMSIKILNFLPKSNHPSSSAPAATTVVKANIDADSSKTLLISSQFDPEKAITPLLPRASSYNSTSNLNNNSIVSFANNHQQRSRRISSDSYLRCDSLPVNSEYFICLFVLLVNLNAMNFCLRNLARQLLGQITYLALRPLTIGKLSESFQAQSTMNIARGTVLMKLLQVLSLYV
ncbi:hypothetical protein V6N12_056644 [Hibiscus sabdariffa]|uniref:Uncharacterized protein n=1 Tax=Hibiscus sabdariffa TaxID=183260 RepID=A0ABR2CT48_9ROSI